jgi:hypothetical protein
MLWEQLVTDGHVRAARLRRLQPWIIALGLVMLWVGIFISQLAPKIQPQSSVASRIQERLAQSQQRAAAAFTQLSQVPQHVDKPESLPPASEIPDVVKAMLQSLSSDNKLPTDSLTVQEAKRDAFWSADWGTERVNYLRSGDTYLFGAYAHLGSSAAPQPVRWVGAFTRTSGKWLYASIAGPSLYVPPGLPGTRPEAVSLTLASFLPPSK